MIAGRANALCSVPERLKIRRQPLSGRVLDRVLGVADGLVRVCLASGLELATRTIATGSAATSIADSAAGGVTVDATALGTNTLTLSGSAGKTVNNLAGNIAAAGLTAAL